MDTIITFIKTNSISLISLVISFFCYIEYRKVNKITLKIDKRTRPNFDLKINDSGYIKKDSNFLYCFTILITNLSDNNNSIKEIHLNINYEENNITSEISLLPLLTKETIFGIEMAKIPLYIEGRNSKLISTQFTFPSELKDKKKFLEYSIVISDSFGKKTSDTTYIINEVNDFE